MLVGNNANELALFASILGQTNLQSPLLKVANGAFGCPSGIAGKARQDNKVKSWRYLYAGEWPNQDLAPGAGAWHGSEIGMVFGTTEYQQHFYGEMLKQKIHVPDTAAQKKLSDVMMTAWSDFAKNPETGLVKLGWPVYDATSELPILRAIAILTIIFRANRHSARCRELVSCHFCVSCRCRSQLRNARPPNGV